MNLILLGYMASGKSKIGKELSKLLNYNFIDLDDYIESQEGCSVKTIFKDKGELYFRKAEHACLQDLLEKSKNTIISLGGGTPCYYNNMELILKNKDAKSLYLKVNIPELVRRLSNEKHKRPLIAHINDDAELTEYIGKHLFERSFYYNQAESVIDANASVETVIESILLKLF